MAYAQAQSTNQKLVTLGGVAALHLAGGYALVVGLAAAGIIETPNLPFEGTNITVTVPLEPPPPKADAPRTEQESAVVTAPTANFNLAPVDLPQIADIAPPIPSERIFIPPVEPIGFATEPARPRNDPGRWVTQDDYRSSWIRRELEGATGFTLTIDANGRVSDCTVTRSSGHGELDAATCQLVMKRARFDPARGQDGGRTGGSYSSSVRWKITD